MYGLSTQNQVSPSTTQSEAKNYVWFRDTEATAYWTQMQTKNELSSPQAVHPLSPGSSRVVSGVVRQLGGAAELEEPKGAERITTLSSPLTRLLHHPAP